MRQIKFVTASLALIAASAIAVAAVRPAALFGQEGEMGPPQPTKEHMMIQKGVGEWVGKLTMNMPGMSSDPVDATESVKAFGPFWTVSHFKCDFEGMAYEGMGSSGYDPMKEQWVSTWQHNSSPELMVMEGEMAEDGTITYRYEAFDMYSQEMKPHHNVLKMDENSYTMDFYMGEGDEAKHTMNISMKRKSTEKK